MAEYTEKEIRVAFEDGFMAGGGFARAANKETALEILESAWGRRIVRLDKTLFFSFIANKSEDELTRLFVDEFMGVERQDWKIEMLLTAIKEERRANNDH